MKPNGNRGGLAAFRASDYLLHTLPFAIKLWLFDIPST